jgi:hypothetical protein
MTDRDSPDPDEAKFGRGPADEEDEPLLGDDDQDEGAPAGEAPSG